MATEGSLSENQRLRPRELFFAFLGAATGGGLGVFWFRVVPEAMAARDLTWDSLTGVAAVVTHPILQITVLVAAAVVMAAGLATRVSSGKDRATWFLASGSTLLFGVLLVSVNALYDPVLSGELPAADEAEAEAPVDDDWED